MKLPENSKPTAEGLAQLASQESTLKGIRQEINELEEKEIRESSLETAEAVRLGLNYIAVGEPRAAMALLKRQPAGRMKEAEMETVGRVSAALVAGDWGAAQGSLAARSWASDDTAAAAKRTTEALRFACLRVVSAAYLSIRLPCLAKMLGLSPEAAAAAASQLGWMPLPGRADLLAVAPLPPHAHSNSPTTTRSFLPTLTAHASALEA